MDAEARRYAARLEVDYPDRLDRLSTALRFVYILPIAIIFGLVTDGCEYVPPPDEPVRIEGAQQPEMGGVERPPPTPPPEGAGDGGVVGGLFLATALMLVFRRRYPRWWFDFLLELTRFSSRVTAYAALLTDRYPSTEDEQAVHIELDYPDAKRLNRWLPLVKWLLALPHVVVLAVLALVAVLAVLVAWFAILITGRYPRPLFDFVVGVGRWGLRVQAYAILLLTDEYPPFSLRANPSRA